MDLACCYFITHTLYCGLILSIIILFLETQKFYEILSKTGTDFTMMKLWFPERTRMEIKVTYA